MSAMNQEVVDLVSSSSESSCSSRGIGLLDGTRPLQCGHVKIDESVGGVEECDENSVSSMDSSLFDAHEIIGDASRQNNNDIGSSSSDIEILSSAGINNSDDTSSSSSSSGLPGSSPLKRPVMMNQPDQDADNSEQSTAIDIDDTVPIASSCKEVSIPPAKRKNSKRRAWGQKSKASKTNNNQANNESSSTVPKQPSSTFNHCYLLRSLDPDHPLKTYIGFTTHPSRRIRQHNGILKNGGARRTRRSGRPWTFCCIVGGFESKTAALQFEWAWQNVGRSKAFREAVGDDVLARKMGRRRGVRARLEELRLLLNVCKPWCESDRFTVYFMEEKIHLQFCELLSKAEKDGKDLSRNSDLTRRVCSVEDMPFAIDLESKKKRGKQAAAAAIIGDEVAESDRSHGDDEESVAKSDERSTSSSSSESDVANVVGLDMRNLSIDQRRYSWEDLSVGSGVETHVTSVGDNDRENKSTNTANKESVPVYDLCDSP